MGKFKNVTFEDEIGLWEAQAIDNYIMDLVRTEKRLGDEKSDWQVLSHDYLRNCYSSLCFFYVHGIQFHLLALLLAEVDGEFDQFIFPLTELGDDKREKLMSPWPSLF